MPDLIESGLEIEVHERSADRAEVREIGRVQPDENVDTEAKQKALDGDHPWPRRPDDRGMRLVGELQGSVYQAASTEQSLSRRSRENGCFGVKPIVPRVPDQAALVAKLLPTPAQ